jgi:hypothetical protein
MIIRFFIISLFLISPSLAGDVSKVTVDKLRTLLYASTNRESALDSLDNYITKLVNSKPDSPLILAYKGAAVSIRAKYNFWPWDKLSDVHKGLELLNKSVDLDKDNLEIRFLRFAVLHNLPSILNYSDEADQEAESIFSLLTNKNYSYDEFLIKNVVEFLINSERLTFNEVKMLKNKFGIT